MTITSSGKGNPPTANTRKAHARRQALITRVKTNPVTEVPGDRGNQRVYTRFHFKDTPTGR